MQEESKDKREAIPHEVLLFNSNIIVERSSSKSSQAVVFFGRETNLGIRVVLKQYNT